MNGAPGVVVRPATYGRNFSYFSHRIFVAHQPGELHEYLHQLLFIDGNATTSDGIEIELVRWLLLHRSQLNPLALNRLVEAWRGPNNELAVPGREGARSDAYRIDITIQFALELELARSHHARWLQERPHLQQARLDAAYYVSRQLPERDPHERAGTHVSAVLDLSKTGRDHFRDYLQRRMNLFEDSDGLADGARSKAALSDEDLDSLLELALSVARTLSSAASGEELQERWNMHVVGAPRDAYGQTPPPSDAVYAALLTGDQCLLRPDPGDPATDDDGQPRRFIWRYVASGAPSTAATVSELARQSWPQRKDIDAVDEWLRHAMWGREVATPPAQALSMLSDDYRVLPTTPPWKSVEMARYSMQEADRGRGKISELTADVGVLNDYAQVLRSPDNASAVSHALLLAAALAGARRATVPAPAAPATLPVLRDEGEWRAALQLVCEGLALDVSSPAAAAANLGRAYGQLREVVAGLPPAAPALPPAANALPWHTALVEAVDAAFKAGLASRSGGRPELDGPPAIAQFAWQALQARLRATPAATPPPAHAVELLAAARNSGPFPLLGLRPEKLPLRTWTAVLIKALERRSEAHAGDLPPATMAVHALERMGFRVLGPQRRQAWLNAAPLPATQRAELQAYADSHGLWSGGQPLPQVALVLGATDTSPSDCWPLPPSSGMVLRLTERELSVLAESGLDACLADVGELRVAWEPGMTDPAGPRRALRKLQRGNRIRELWLYWPNAVGEHSPRLVGPRSADELWQDLPAAA